MNPEAILEVRDAVLQVGNRRILNGVSMEIWPGHVHAIVGPNGAGKSSLASAIMGLSGYTDVQGDITLDGESIKSLSVHERALRGITLGWQEPARFEGLRVGDFIRAGVRNGTRRTVATALELVGLDPGEYLNRAVDRTLSGGERKRIELASILAMSPRLVLLDEPDSGIDVDALNRIFAAIQHLKSNGATVVMITHSQTVLRQAEHAFLMCSGRIINKGTVEKIEPFFGETCLPCDHPNIPDEVRPQP